VVLPARWGRLRLTHVLIQRSAWKGYSRKSDSSRSRIPRSDRATIFCMNVGGGERLALIAPWRGLRGRYLKADGFGLGKGERERFA
jgi:hypothetical protein